MLKINWKHQFQQYGVAIAVASFLFAVLSLFIFYRRGYYDLYIANKVFAGVATVLLGIVLLIGPSSRLFSFAGRYLQFRKELGIVAFTLALTHGVASFFFLPDKFPPQQFLGTGRWPFIFGLIAVIILAGLFLISTDSAMTAIGRKTWWRLQYWGVRLVFTLVLLHVFVMKWGGWVSWYKVGGANELVHPEWPGAGLLTGWFIVFVVLARLAELAGPRLGRILWYTLMVALLIIYGVTFWWGRQLTYGSD